MKRKLLNRMLSVLLALVLLLALVPSPSLNAQAAASPEAEKPSAKEQTAAATRTEPTSDKAQSADDPKAAFALRHPGSRGDEGWDFDVHDAIDLELDEELELSFAAGQECIWLRLTVESLGVYQLTSFGDADVYVSLYGEDGTYIDGNDDGGVNMNFLLSSLLAEGSTFYYRIGCYNEPGDCPPFSVLLTRSDFECIDLKPDVELELNFSENQSFIWLRFVPAAFGEYCLSSFGDADVYVNLYDENSHWIGSSDDYDWDLNFRLSALLDADRTYYFQIGHYHEPGTCPSFSVVLTGTEIELFELKPDVELDLALNEAQNAIWLRYIPEHTGLYCLSSSGDADVYVILMDEYGDYLSQDDDGGEGWNFSLSAILSKGRTYYYQVQSFTDPSYYSSCTVLLTEEAFDPIPLVPDTMLDVAFEEGQTDVWLSFMTKTDGEYCLSSFGDIDPYVELMDANGSSLGSDDDSGEGWNFSLWSYLAGEQTYYYRLRHFGPTDTPAKFFVLLTEYKPATSGECGAQGDNLLWSFDPDTGVLTIEGSGDMMDYDYWEAPWQPFSDRVTEVHLPEGMSSVGSCAFCECKQLTEVTVPDTVDRIGDSAFCRCIALSSVTLPNHLTYLGFAAFKECFSLSSMTLPEGLTSIEHNTFAYCTALSSVVIPEGITVIGTFAFEACSFDTVTLPESVNRIEAHAFNYCSDLASVRLPAGISRIGAGAFEGCGKLDMLVIRNADCLAGFLSESYDPEDTEEDLEYYYSDSTLGEHYTVIYGRHDQEKLESGNIENRYQYAEAYAANFGYTFYDLYAFTDVREYSWYEIPVAWACGNGITAGTGEGTFSPGNTCTREQTVTFLWKAAGSPEPETTENPFTDVKETKYYYKAVLWALENGITAGVDVNLFGVGLSCTREQVVSFLWKAAGSPEPYTQENPFTDVKPNKYYYKPILWAVENGITAGVDVNLFGVGMSCTRAQIVTFLYVSRNTSGGTYSRGDDDAIYESVFGEFAELMEQSRNAETNDGRFVLEAQAEAALLDTAAMIPLTSRGGYYALSRVAPHTKSYAQWGNGQDRLHSLVISDEFLTPAERSDLEAQWEAAVAGAGTYDPAAYLTEKGHSLADSLTATFNNGPVTLDWLDTASNADSFVLVNCVDGLVEYDNLGDLRPALAESWEVSDDGLTYTFHIRQGVKWVTAEGSEYAELTANDFVAGFQHMLDCQAGPEALAGSGGAEIAGVYEYLWEGGSFENVGCKATDDYTLVYRLNKPVPYFMTMLSYSTFLPLCDAFYRAKGGVYGMEEYWNAIENGSYTFAQIENVDSQVYCGPFLLKSLDREDEILCVKNPNYYKAEEVTLDSIRWIYSYNYSSYDLYADTVRGLYAEIILSQADTLDLAFSDGNFEQYAYVTENESVTYFGALNLNRGTFELENGACASFKSEQEKADTFTALNNRNFRKALQHAFDKRTYNSISRGEMLAESNLRNMYTTPDLVKLESAFTDAEGHTFAAGTLYGEMVQYYCDRRGCLVDCADGQDGWFKPDAAWDYLSAAKAELGSSVSWPIQIDVVYADFSNIQTAQANTYKENIESVLGSENVVVNLIPAYSPEDYYACGYRAANGEAGNFDMFYGSGWSADYGDPSTYLNTFDPSTDGYMLKTVGLY